MNDAEKLREIVMEYEAIQEFNSMQVSSVERQSTKRVDDHKEHSRSNYRHAPQLSGCIFSKEEAKLIDALTIPFDVRVKEEAFFTRFRLDQCKNENGVYTYRGHDKEYYEWLRKDTIRKISEQDDQLGKAWLIEEYGKQILEASNFFEIVEAMEMLKDR